MKRLHYLAFGISAAALAAPAAGQSRLDIDPYIEVQQVFSADLNEDDVLTYTSVAAGVDGSVSTRRVEAQISYRYERHIGWGEDLADEDVHSGLAQISAEVVPGLSLDAGGLAARASGEGGSIGFDTTSSDAAEVYAAYGGPSISTNVGPLAVNANYRLGYVKVDDDSVTGGFAGGRENFDSSVTHSASASVGMDAGPSPVGWTVGAGYAREDVEQLDGTFEAKYARADVVVPVSPSFAVTGGVGYEEIEASQQDFARNADGSPVVTPDGELVANPAAPRLLAVGIDGMIWDVGVIWRPSPRVELQARVGERYDDWTFTGTLEYQLTDAYGLSLVVYDSVDSFGRLLVDDLTNVPTKFDLNNGGFGGGLGSGGCVFGKEAGSGVCFDGSLQSLAGGNFRNRGASLVVSGGRGPWTMGLGVGYARRNYFAPGAGVIPVDDVTEQIVSVEGQVGRELTSTSGIDFDAYASWYDSGLAGDDNYLSAGVSSLYYRSFLLERLRLQAALGLYTTQADNEDSTIASALVGMRYQF